MNAQAKRKPTAVLANEIVEGGGYDVVRRQIGKTGVACRGQPSLEVLAEEVGEPPDGLRPLLDAPCAAGVPSPASTRDLVVTHAISPGDHKTRGAGLTISWGYHISPFGIALVMVTARGLAALAFNDPGGERAAFSDMARRWPNATYVEDMSATAPYATRIFEPKFWRADQPLGVMMIGTDFQLRVWEALLRIPMGTASTYSSLAASIGAPGASRAVGAAVGANPMAFVVPCHRVIGKSGGLTGYHWGLTRKRAIIGWEAEHISNRGLGGRGAMAEVGSSGKDEDDRCGRVPLAR